MQENFVIFLSMIIANMHNKVWKSRLNSRMNRQTARFCVCFLPAPPPGAGRFLGNLYKGGRPLRAHPSRRSCCPVTRGRQISFLPCLASSSIATAVIWLLW